MAQRQASMRYLRYRERVINEARKRGATDEMIARIVPPLDEDDLAAQKPHATRKSVIENLRFLFGARDNELIIWSMLPLLRETPGDGYYLPQQGTCTQHQSTSTHSDSTISSSSAAAEEPSKETQQFPQDQQEHSPQAEQLLQQRAATDTQQ